MCGLAGFFRPADALPLESEVALARMTGSLVHRGPDDGGAWLNVPAGIALGHRRLAIIDLSAAGRQPMYSASGKYVLAFNGEIYNHLALRSELQGAGGAPPWRGHSDTETLLAGFAHWGIEATLRRARGMFAFALWDQDKRCLTLGRDRMGEKPLYYGWQGDLVLFGSELKALRAHPAFRAEVDRDALTQLMSLGYIAAPASIYRNIRKLEPGTFVTIARQTAPGHLPQPQPYWSLRELAERGLSTPFSGTEAEAVAELESELRRAVLEQTISDVPLGAFLSGGIDSTTVVALLQAQSTRRVKTFTIGFHEADFQEAPYATAVAKHLGTDHAELYVTSKEAMQVIPRLCTMYDEPLGDSSAIPTHLVAEFARRQVTVSLSGDGGDELFGGYTRYGSTGDIWHNTRRIPAFARRLLSAGCEAWARSSRSKSSWRAHRMARYLAANDADACYAAKIEQWPDADDLVLGGNRKSAHTQPLASDSIFARMMFRDAMTYLPDDILAKVDRAAMAVSLETRIPMLDARIVELAWSFPLGLKVRDGRGKWLLRRVLEKYVPTSLTERPKMGFGIPVGEWIRGPLRPWAEELLAESRLRRDGFLNTALVRDRWLRHLEGSQDATDSLWPVLMFQAWLMQDLTAARRVAA